MDKTLYVIIKVIGVIGLVISIFAIAFSFIPCIGVYAFIFGIIGFAPSLVAFIIFKINKEKAGLELAGAIIGFVAILISAAQVFFFVNVAGEYGDQFNEALEKAKDEIKRDSLLNEVEADSWYDSINDTKVDSTTNR